MKILLKIKNPSIEPCGIPFTIFVQSQNQQTHLYLTNFAMKLIIEKKACYVLCGFLNSDKISLKKGSK